MHITLSYLVELCIEVLHIDSTNAAFDETAAAKWSLEIGWGGLLSSYYYVRRQEKSVKNWKRKKKAEKPKNWEINRTHFQSSLKERISVYIIAQVKQGLIEQ